MKGPSIINRITLFAATIALLLISNQFIDGPKLALLETNGEEVLPRNVEGPGIMGIGVGPLAEDTRSVAKPVQVAAVDGNEHTPLEMTRIVHEPAEKIAARFSKDASLIHTTPADAPVQSTGDTLTMTASEGNRQSDNELEKVKNWPPSDETDEEIEEYEEEDEENDEEEAEDEEHEDVDDWEEDIDLEEEEEEFEDEHEEIGDWEEDDEDNEEVDNWEDDADDVDLDEEEERGEDDEDEHEEADSEDESDDEDEEDDNE